MFSTLENAKAQNKSQEITVVMGNLNTNVGKELDGEIVGKLGLGT